MEKIGFAEKRVAIKKQQEKAVYEDLLKTLEDALEVEKAGNTDESNAMIEAMRLKLEGMIQESEKYMEKSIDAVVDRNTIPEAGAILAENDYVILKMISPEERNLYIDVSYECSAMKSMFKDQDFKNDLWNEFLSEYEAVASIYDKKTGNYIGYCSVKDMRKSDWEIAIEEKKKYRNLGYGYNALSLFISQISKLTGHSFFRARIDIDNTASQNLLKKLGGYPDGISEFLLHGDDLAEFQKENILCIDDEIKAIAEEFCVEPEDLLGHVLEYRLDSTNITV